METHVWMKRKHKKEIKKGGKVCKKEMKEKKKEWLKSCDACFLTLFNESCDSDEGRREGT